jgi:hypothetical protein
MLRFISIDKNIAFRLATHCIAVHMKYKIAHQEYQSVKHYKSTM